MIQTSETSSPNAAGIQDAASAPSFRVALVGFLVSTTLTSTVMVLLSGL